MLTLSGGNVQHQPLLSTFNEKKKKIKYDHNTFSDMTKQTINEDSGHSGHPPSLTVGQASDSMTALISELVPDACL